MNDEQFHRVVDYLGYSRRGYRRVRKGVKKRLDRHMAELGCPTVDRYLERLEQSRQLLDDCRLLMTVPISRFFRDAVLWQRLLDTVLPDLVERFKTPLSIWCAGCAGGEEVYSLRILWEEFATVPLECARPYILATDIHPEQIERAKAAVYPKSSLKELPPELLERWFEPIRGGRRYRVREAARSGITWQVRDTSDTEGIPGFCLIFFRNSVLTYYRDPERHAVFQKVRNRLARGGVLVVGSHETLPESETGFTRWLPWCYRLE